MATSWTLNNGVLTISGTGVMDNYTSSNHAPWYENRTLITSAIIENGVTSIGNSAFYNCTLLTSVTIPNSVTSIGERAFYGCTTLTDIYYTGNETDWNAITIDANNEPLLNATIHHNLTYLVTKAELTSIANAIRAKAGTTSKYTWPNQMISAIEGLTIGSVVDWTGGGSINITSDKALSDTYFYDNSGNLTQGNISIQQSATGTTTIALSPSSFQNNGNPKTGYQHKKGYYNGTHHLKLKTSTLSIITITPSTSSQTVTLYGPSATYNYFPYAITIESATTNENTNWISNRSAISGTYSNNTITKIDSGAFYMCSKLTTADFSACTSIGQYAFQNCSSLTTVSFPVCTKIGLYAFSGCNYLTTAYFPNLPYVNFNMSFYGKQYLSNVTILGRSTSAIDGSTFKNCYRLTNLTILYSEGVAPLVETTAFNSTPISTFTSYTNGVYGSIYVPSSLVAAYKSATNWAIYSKRITSIPS